MNLFLLITAVLGLCALPIGQGSYYSENGFLDGKIVCYVQNAAGLRKEEVRFLPFDLDPKLCTHGIYGFAGITESFGVFATSKSVDLNQTEGGHENGYRRFVALKKKSRSFVPMLGVGGENEHFTERFSLMASSEKSRETFIDCLIKFAQTYGFSGVNIDWQDPGVDDKDNYVTFLQEARANFDEAGLLLSISGSGNVFVAMDGYDLQAIAKHVEFITIRGYDLHDCSEKYTHHHTALGQYHGCSEKDKKLYVEHAMRHFSDNVDPEDTRKIILGIPTYGRTYCTLPDDKGMCAEATCGREGPYIEEQGIYSYGEICNQNQINWKKTRNPSMVSPYAVYYTDDSKDHPQWIAYDDEVSIREKCIVARDYGLGGAMVWSVDMDDYQSICGLGPFYVTNIIRRHCHFQPITTPVTPISTTTTTTPVSTSTTTTVQPSPDPYDGIMVCYIDNAAAFREGDGKFYPYNLDASLCDFGIYGFAGITRDAKGIYATLKSVDLPEYADGYRKFVQLQKRNPDFKPLLGIGGYNDEFNAKFSKMASRRNYRAKFIDNVITFLNNYGFVGANIDWYDPKRSDKAHLTKLVREMKHEFDVNGLILSIAASARIRVLKRSYDLKAISREVEFISLRAYDYHDCGESFTHHHTAYGEYADSKKKDILLNAVDASNYAVGEVISSSKLVLGIPAYGRTYSLCTDATDVYAPARCNSDCEGPFTKEKGKLSYYEICDQYYGDEKAWTTTVDSGMISPYATYHCPNTEVKELQWISYDNLFSIEKKCELVRDLNMGGAMLWSADQDDFLGDNSKWCRNTTFALLRLIRENCFAGPTPTIIPTSSTTTTPTPLTITTPTPSTITTPTPSTTTTPTPSTTTTLTPSTTTTPTPSTTLPSSSTSMTPTPSTTATPTSSTTIPRSSTSMTQTTSTTTTPTPSTTKPSSSSTTLTPSTTTTPTPSTTTTPTLSTTIPSSLSTTPTPSTTMTPTPSTTTTPTSPTTTTPTVSSTATPTLSTTITSSSTYTTPTPSRTTTPTSSTTTTPSDSTTTTPTPSTTTTLTPSITTTPAPLTTIPSSSTSTTPTPSTTTTPTDSTTTTQTDSTTTAPTPSTTVPSSSTSKTPTPSTTMSPTPSTTIPSSSSTTPTPSTTTTPTPSTTTTLTDSTTTTPTPSTTTTPTPSTTTTPTGSTTTTPTPPPEGKVVCYVASRAEGRPSEGQFFPWEMDPKICTHGIYGFAGLFYNYTIKSLNPNFDFGPAEGGKIDGYRQFTNLKTENVHFKALLGVGGYDDVSNGLFGEMIKEQVSRKTFVDSCVEFLKTFGFDGLNIDWYFPGNDPDDKDSLYTLMQELNEEFSKHDLSLSIAASAKTDVLQRGYNLKRIAAEVDFMSIMAFDFHTCDERYTHHHTPIYGYPKDEGALVNYNVDAAVRYFIDQHVPPKQLLLGFPMFGRTYTLNNASHDVYAPAYCGIEGRLSKQAGFLSQYEICDFSLNSKWTAYRDPDMESYYAVYENRGHEDQWVSYDTKETIEEKCQIATSLKLGGAMIWSVDSDDFQGDYCDQGPFPVVRLVGQKCAGL